MKILHITTHLGGGVGKAISGLAVQGQQLFPDTHRIILLQEPEKSGYVRVCEEHHIPVELWRGETDVLCWADVIVVSWWNHPAMARFLRNFPPVSVPVVLWSHANGCHYPFLSAQLALTFDEILFTTPYSLQNRLWTSEERESIRARGEVVYGMGSFQASALVPKEHYDQGENFVIGYGGTLNYGKLHPQFVKYCQAVCARIPGVRFVMAGDRDAGLERDICSAGLEDRFSFPGFVEDMPDLMRSFDVFGYLLQPEHYGTTENVLLEAMAVGLPVVVLHQNVEQFIVPETAGAHVETPEEYGEQMARLQRDPAARGAAGHRARQHVLREYSAEENTVRFRAACRQASYNGTHDFSFLGDDPWSWFLYGLGEESRSRFMQAQGEGDGAIRALLRTCPPILWEERKSSLRHFANVYPEDETLRQFKRNMEDLYYGRSETKL